MERGFFTEEYAEEYRQSLRESGIETEEIIFENGLYWVRWITR